MRNQEGFWKSTFALAGRRPTRPTIGVREVADRTRLNMIFYGSICDLGQRFIELAGSEE
jgi:hypothetical protein